MTMRLEAFGGWRGVVERLIRREDLSGDEAAAALAALLRSLGFVKVTVVFEQPPATWFFDDNGIEPDAGIHAYTLTSYAVQDEVPTSAGSAIDELIDWAGKS